MSHLGSYPKAVVLIALLTLLAAGAGLRAPRAQASDTPTDVMFVVDTTGSMSDALDEARSEMGDAMTSISAKLSNVQFGVGQVRDYEDPYGDPGDKPWQIVQPVTPDRGAITDAFDGLAADQGGDSAEAYGRALYEADVSADAGWRPGARRLIVLVADDVPHDLDLNRDVPARDQTQDSPWDTGADPGRDGVIGTSDDLAWLDVLHRLQRDAVPLLFVFYHGSSEYLPYWKFWAGMTGGEVSQAGESSGTLGTEITDLVQRNAAPCATDISGPPTPAAGKTAQSGAPPTSVQLRAPAGTRFCSGTTVAFGGAKSDSVIAGDGTTLAAPLPRAAGSGLTLTLPGRTDAIKLPFEVDNFRSPWGFQFLNSGGYATHGFTVTYRDLAKVFGDAAVYVKYPLACKTCAPYTPKVVSAAGQSLLYAAQSAAEGMCFGFSLGSQRFFHGDRKVAEFLPPGPFTVTSIGVPGKDNPDASPVWPFIRQQQISQIATQIVAAQTAARVTRAADIRARLTAAFAAGDRPMVTLSFRYNGEWDGHALVAYDVEDSGSGFDIDVYDPNVPSDAAGTFGSAEGRSRQLQHLKVHVAANGTWNYDGTFSGDFADSISGSVDALRVVPYSALPAKGLRSPSGASSDVATLAPPATGATLTQVTDASGHTLFAPDGSVNTDPASVAGGVTVVPFAAGPGGGLGVQLAAGGSYHLGFSPVAGAALARQSVLGSSMTGSVTVTAPAAGGQYEAVVLPRGIGFQTASAGAPASSSTELQLTTHDATGGDRGAVAKLEGSASHVTLSFSRGSGAVEATSPDSAVRGTLTLSQTGGGALPVNATVRLRLARGERIVLRPSSWSSLSRVAATVRRSNGRVRRTLLTPFRHTEPGTRLSGLQARATGKRVRIKVRYSLAARTGTVSVVSYKLRRNGRTVAQGHTILRSRSGLFARTVHTRRGHGSTLVVTLTRLSGGASPSSLQIERSIGVQHG